MLLILTNFLLALSMTHIVCTYITLFGNPQCRPILWRSVQGMYLCFLWAVTSAESPFPLATLGGNILFLLWLYRLAHKDSFKNCVFRTLIFFAVYMSVEVAVNCMILLVLQGEDVFLMGDAICQIVVYLGIQIYGRIGPKKEEIPLPLRYWLELFIFPAVSVWIIYDTYIRSQTDGSNIALILVTFLMILMNFAVYDVYKRMASYTLAGKQAAVYAQTIELCDRQAKEREAAYRQTRMLRHDLNDRLIALDALIEQRQYDDARREIDEMLYENKLPRNEISRSGNLALDALINYKHSVAQTLNADLSCLVEVPADLSVDGTDLCVILGNLLDNALEAVTLLPREERQIKLEIRLEKGLLRILTENPYKGKIEERYDGTLKSRKPGDGHGFGLLSVRRAVDKYGGELCFPYDDTVFRACVTLYLP